MKEGKASALGDWVGGMAAPGGPSVPQVEEGKESWLPPRSGASESPGVLMNLSLVLSDSTAPWR